WNENDYKTRKNAPYKRTFYEMTKFYSFCVTFHLNFYLLFITRKCMENISYYKFAIAILIHTLVTKQCLVIFNMNKNCFLLFTVCSKKLAKQNDGSVY